MSQAALGLSLISVGLSLYQTIRLPGMITEAIAQHEKSEIQKLKPFLNRTREAFGQPQLDPQTYSEAALGILQGMGGLFEEK